MKTSSLRSIRVKPERLREAGKLKIVPKEETGVENDNVQLKIEPPEEIDEKPKLIVLPEKKENEPTATALAPVQKVIIDETLSPVESSEIPAVNIEEEEHKAVEIIEIPPKNDPPHQDIIELDSTDAYKTINSVNSNGMASETVITEVKKQKLDILKQGGLEVTPVRNVTDNRKELRPSVIQSAITHRAEIIPNSVNVDDKKQMPPPQLATLTKRPVQVQPLIRAISIPITSQLPIYTNKTYSYSNQSPPKVLQSKSIYSPSGETIYGDPKEVFQPTIHNIQAPKYMEYARQQTGGALLDLTVKSPQKPTANVTQMLPYQIQNPSLVIPAPLSLLDSRKVIEIVSYLVTFVEYQTIYCNVFSFLYQAARLVSFIRVFSF